MPTTYAEVEDVLVTRRQATSDPRYLAAVERALVNVTSELTQAIGYTFFRSPATGTETWTTTGPGGRLLHVHQGIAALTLIEVRLTVRNDWIALDAADWVLEGEVGEPVILDGEPAYHVALLGTGSVTRFPTGRQLVRLTGARGWDEIPARARSATVAMVRQRVGLDQANSGGPMGPEDLGGRFAPDRWPREAYDLLTIERTRHRGCSA